MRNKLFLLAALTILVLAMSACAAAPAPVAVQPADSESAVFVNQNTTVNVIVDQNADGCTTCGDSVPAVVAPAFVPIPWDTTCTTQSALVGVTLTPLAEGDFYACTYHGPRVNISIPEGTYADIDLGQVFVGKGPLNVDGVSNLTLRPWTSGQESELCAHLKDLTTYGSQQTPVFTPSALNFSCPAQ